MLNKKKMSKKEGVLKIFAPIFAVAVTFLACYLVTIKPDSFWLAGGICAVLYVGILMLSVFIAESIDEKKSKKAGTGPMLTGVMYEKIDFMDEPAVICDSFRKIVWANKYIRDTNPDGVVGASVSSLFEYQIKDGLIGRRPVDSYATYMGKIYIIDEEPIRGIEKNYYLLTLQ